jgi:aminocarboxymuconate-semialdehyde decarboxylase
MDKHGVDIQALSQTAPVLLGSSPEQAAEICRLSNLSNFELCRKYPTRFINICLVSLLDRKSAFNELERSVQEMDCRGVTVGSNQAGEGLDNPRYSWFFETLAEYDLPLLLQPTDWQSYPLVNGEKQPRLMLEVGWPFDTTQAVLRLILGGVFDRFPSLKVITHHCGAMLPSFASRLEAILGQRSGRDLASYWKNIYGDTAVHGSLPACQCGYSFFGAERMLFGTDYPFASPTIIQDSLSAVKALPIPRSETDLILGLNAARLLKISR